MPQTCIRFGEFGARVMIERKEIEHYAMQVDPVKREVSCWIASEVGKAFSVVWLELDIDFPTSGRICLDGNYGTGFLRTVRGPIAFEEHHISASLAAPYLFSPLDITDDDAFLDRSSCSIGEIKLVIYRTSTPVSADHRGHAQPELQKIHERSKKAMSHQVNYGRQVTIPRRICYNAKPIEKLVTFIFKYRPLEMLQANEIAPRSPEPVELQESALDTPGTSSGKRKHSKVKEEYDSETESEGDEESKREKVLLAEVQRRQAEVDKCRAEVERIRRARRLKDGERPPKKVKKENTESSFIPGEIIDLT